MKPHGKGVSSTRVVAGDTKTTKPNGNGKGVFHSDSSAKSDQVLFFKDVDKQVLLISQKAGGLGLNLTAASNVFLLDTWWPPAMEEEAIMEAMPHSYFMLRRLATFPCGAVPVTDHQIFPIVPLMVLPKKICVCPCVTGKALRDSIHIFRSDLNPNPKQEKPLVCELAYKLLEAHMGLIFEFPLLENHMEEVLVVSSMNALLRFHSLNLTCNSILIEDQEVNLQI